MKSAQCLVFLASLFALAAIVAPMTTMAAPKSACDTLTLAEIGKVLGGKVVIDQSQSGPDDRSGDNCVWTGPNKSIILIRVQPVADKNQVQTKYKEALEQAYSGGRAPEALAGVGDEAKYRDYSGNLKGGVIVGRKGQVLFVVEGSASRDALGALAGVLISRM